MNLGIEYLLRSGAIRSFFQTPCSLFLERAGGRGRLVISIEEAEDKLAVKHWDFDRMAHDLLPAHARYEIARDEVFTSERVIVPGYQPIPYHEQPLVASWNAHNHPMDFDQFNGCVRNFLNSLKHRAYKADWLWRAFIDSYFMGLLSEEIDEFEGWQRRVVVDRQQTFVRNRYKHYWFQWVVWKNELIKDEAAASELVFSSAYAGCRNPAPARKHLYLGNGDTLS